MLKSFFKGNLSFLPLFLVLIASGCVFYQNRIQKILLFGDRVYGAHLVSNESLTVYSRDMTANDFSSVSTKNVAFSQAFYWKQYLVKIERKKNYCSTAVI